MNEPILIELSRAFVYAISQPDENFDFSDTRFMGAACKACGDSGFVPAIWESPVFCDCKKGDFRITQWYLEQKHGWLISAYEREGFGEMDRKAAEALGLIERKDVSR